MCAVEGIFSLRIVTADFYMEKPKSGLDPCFIEFRSKDIKKVPVIRIFGSSAEGQKTCMHVHGIFPYMYIPYDKKDFETLDKAIYLIASSIDKAINISLGQGSSESHHVFKIQLVKGIPFYGYHKKDHQYLKIYMLNPRFIRRTATLLQNGAIMGKIFQPHESHVPYILQFFIDYNLYGMSFLHVPKEVLKFRRKNADDVVPYPIQKEQLLDCITAEKISTSELELDIGSGFILNRFQLITKTGTHSNPGIESIWQDERIRREKLSKERIEIPSLEIPISQDRPNVKPTESHEFYRNGLIQKLHQLETSMDVTMNATLQNTITPAEVSVKEKKRTFNLKKLIANAVYPEECTQSDVLTNASFIADHYSNRSIFHNSIKLPETSSNPESDDVFMDDTIVDEDLVLSLTQPNVVNQSLREEDMELLDVMQQLEDGDGENEIDLDSTLAPLSQNLDLNSPPKGPESTSIGFKTSAFDSREDDSDNECLNDFSVIMDDMDELLLRLSQPSQSSNSIPQYDGADDIPRTPTKSNLRKLPPTPKTPITPKTGTKTINGSPKTPKSIAKKYAPLPVIIQSRSLKKNLMSTTKQSEIPFRHNSDEDEIISSSPEDSERSKINAQKNSNCLRKKLAITEMRRKSISSASEINGEFTPRSIHKRRKTIDLDKTHITCNLRTPRRTNEKRLKVYSANALPGKDSIELGDSTETENLDFYTENESETSNLKTPTKSPRVMLKKSPLESEIFSKLNNKAQPKECNGLSSTYDNTSFKSLQFAENLGYRIIPFEKKSYPNKHSPLKNNEDKVESRQHMVKIKPPKKFSLIASSRSPESNECNTSIINNIKMSPTVVLRRGALELGTPNLIELSTSGVSQHKTSLTKLSPITHEKKRSISKKTSPRVVLKRNKMSNKLHNNSNPECPDLSDTSAAEHELSKSDSINELNISSGNENKMSPRVVLRKCQRIKGMSLEDIKSANLLLEENKTSKRKPRLSLRSHEKIKKKKAQDNIKRIDIEEDYSSCDNVEDNLALSKLKKSFSSSNNIEDNIPLSKLRDQLHESISSPSVKKNKSSPRRLRIQLKRAKIKEIQTITPVKEPATTPNTPITTEKPYSVDDKYEITPIAGPSHLDRYKIANIHSQTPKRSLDVGESDNEDDPTVHSFYEKSFIVESPVFSEISVPSPAQVKCNQQVLSPSVDKVVIITPRQLPETYEEVQQNCKFYDIPDVVHKKPFYSNYADVTQRKEVGHTVLCIPGKSLNDVDDFRSSISELEGFVSFRKKMMTILGVQTRNEDNIREYLATGKTVLITPCKLPPTKQDAKVWVKARELLIGKNLDVGEKETAHFEEDSPIKIHRKKVVMLMENESGESGEDMDCSMRSITMTPLTPMDNKNTETPEVEDLYNCTPVTGQKSESKFMRKRRPLRARVSLSQKLKDICISNALEKCIGDPPPINCVTTENPLKTMNEDEIANSQDSSQSNETVTSEAVLAELEKSSFVKNLHDSQGSLDASFGLSIASLNNTYGFKVNLENLQQAKADVEHNYLTTLSLELFVSTREDLLPNPELDAIRCIFYSIENSIPSTCTDGVSKTTGLIIVADGDTSARYNGIDSEIEIKVVSNEIEGFAKLLELCAHWDPDIFVGYEIEMSSWGYLIERGKHLNLNIAPLLSRVPSQKVRDFFDEDRDQMTDLDVETKLCGRILLDVWRLMRSEIALTSYTFENVMYHILHRRCPLHTHKKLTQWFKMPQTRWIVLEYYLERVRGTLELLDQLDLIGRTGEMAKLIGIQFYEVLSRGSQFRVESMMLRIAKPRNLVPISPSVQQRAHMRAPEYLALILEPQSRFYPDPVIVLDFQSLYPSIIMAYNYCFSTCLGRVEHLGQSVPFEFGASQLRVSPTVLRKLLESDLVTISPCGAVFVKREIREGILPRMLTEVLDTRQMVKQSMKVHKNSTALQRILHSRQLGLKLIANVTYGYTAANFSGRMPCVEVGDSVVSKGRETLERAIKLVEANEQWNVKVVYGDTDSLFVLVPGRSRAEAFKIGAEIAELVTEDNPHPVKLKLEKVYQPCILQTKKRYVGYMYESPDQAEPVYEAKGIETVRRDGCPAAAKMLEKCLRILFESADVSQVKNYVCRQFTKLLSGKANIQDLIFAKEFRGLNGYKPTACVPALELTRKWMQIDPRKIPRRGERVPFIVTNGPPGLPLIKLVRSPYDLLADEGLKINAIYYITKAIIPPLNRCFLLIGADVNEWFTNLPRKILFTPALSTAKEIVATNATKKSTISQYFSSTNCVIDCGRQTKEGICTFCEADATKSVVTLEEKISKLQRGYRLSQMICQACCGRSNFIDCASLDCPVAYVLEVKRRELTQVLHYQSIIDERAGPFWRNEVYENVSGLMKLTFACGLNLYWMDERENLFTNIQTGVRNYESCMLPKDYKNYIAALATIRKQIIYVKSVSSLISSSPDMQLYSNTNSIICIPVLNFKRQVLLVLELYKTDGEAFPEEKKSLRYSIEFSKWFSIWLSQRVKYNKEANITNIRNMLTGFMLQYVNETILYEQFLWQFMKHCKEHIKAEKVFFYDYDCASGFSDFYEETGETIIKTTARLKFRKTNSFCYEVLKNKKPLLVNLEDDCGKVDKEINLDCKTPIRYMFLYPILFGDWFLGIMVFGRTDDGITKDNAFVDDDKLQLSTVTSLLSDALVYKYIKRENEKQTACNQILRKTIKNLLQARMQEQFNILSTMSSPNLLHRLSWELDDINDSNQLTYLYNIFQRTYRFDMNRLKTFLMCTQLSHNQFPYHNFKTSFHICRTVYFIMDKLGSKLKPYEKAALMIAAVVYYCGHTGLNTHIMINSKHPLTKLYKTYMKENHRIWMLKLLLDQTSFLPTTEESQYIISTTTTLLLKSKQYESHEFRQKILKMLDEGTFNLENASHRSYMLMVILRIGVHARHMQPFNVAKQLCANYYEEILRLGISEPKKGYDFTELTNCETSFKISNMEISYINNSILTTLDILTKIFPETLLLMKMPKDVLRAHQIIVVAGNKRQWDPELCGRFQKKSTNSKDDMP